MPEGDSIARAAARLRPYLVGAEIRGLRLRERGDVPSVLGLPIQAIDTHGKHMMIRIGEDRVLRVHLGMHGRWRLHPVAEASRFDRSHAAVVLRTDGCVAVCREAMAAQLRSRRDPGLQHVLRNLGPDLLAPAFDLDQVIARARREDLADRPIAELLLDQRVAAGIGNVYKSEVLFLGGVHPMTPVRAVDDETLRQLFTSCRRLMKLNLGPGMRTTTARAAVGVRRPPSQSRHFVYRRRALPCLRCGTPIERALVGDMARSTYWCPRCQPAPG